MPKDFFLPPNISHKLVNWSGCCWLCSFCHGGGYDLPSSLPLALDLRHPFCLYVLCPEQGGWALCALSYADLLLVSAWF